MTCALRSNTPRCETSTSGGTACRLHRLHASFAMHHAACIPYMAACVCVRTIRHQLIVRGSKSIQHQTGYCAVRLADINMRFRQRNIPEAVGGGPGKMVSTQYGSIPGGTDLLICSASSNVERRTSIRVPRIGTRLDDRRGPRHAKLKTRAAWTDPSLTAVGRLADWLD